MTILYIYKEEDIHQSNELACLRDGYHYIGREAPIVSKDKRISRKHAIVIVHKNGAIIKAAHVNPTFFKSPIGGLTQILKENDTLTLHNGDSFALVEDSIWFTVKIEVECVESATVNDVSFNTICNKRVREDNIFENQKRIKIEDESVTHDNDTLNSSNHNPLPQLNQVPIGNNYSEKPNNVNGPELDETLPLVSTHRHDAEPINPDLLSSNSAVNRSNENVDISSSTVDLNETIPVDSITHPSTSNPCNIQLDNSTKNSLNTIHIKEEPLDNVTDSTVSNFHDSTIKEESPQNIKVEPSEEIKEMSTTTIDESPGNDHQPSTSTNNSTENRNDRRDKCWYGNQCYRKNLVHKEKFSHPGDKDYNSDINDNSRPACPFGLHCYRRNVMHRRQYRHFGPPAPKPNNVNVHVNVVNYPPNPSRKPGYESDCESNPDE